MPDARKPDPDGAVYPLLAELDRLEDLLEEMDELRIETRADVERRMSEINAEIDRSSGA